MKCIGALLGAVWMPGVTAQGQQPVTLKLDAQSPSDEIAADFASAYSP
jgi:hypothetical protein